mmetsp:Transcript_73766/g.196637  ORF Transcript_73766/g.196637 Transcript_73766/m.196637 type:complete len:499 (-) Transcript_73766:27-1523(-)
MCHTIGCEFPIDGCDYVYAVVCREPVNPRPLTFLRIVEDQAQWADAGCGCYSEGVNDDVNKYVWSALHWGADEKGPLAGSSREQVLRYSLRQWACLLAGVPRSADALVDGIFGLEQTWRKSAADSHPVQVLRKFQQVEVQMTPRHMRECWRVNMLLFRAYYDAFLHRRFLNEQLAFREAGVLAAKGFEDEAKLRVRQLVVPLDGAVGLQRSINVVALGEAREGPGDVTHLYARCQALALTLNTQTGYQLSVGHGGQHRQRGASFDNAWAPLGEAVTLQRALDRGDPWDHLTSPPPVPALTPIWYASFGDPDDTLVVGPGAARDRLGVAAVVTPHRPVALGEDPTFFARPLVEHAATDNDAVLARLVAGEVPRAWRSWVVGVWPETAVTEFKFPVDALKIPKDAALSVRVTYVGLELCGLGGDWEELERIQLPTRMVANGVEVHGFLQPERSTRSRVFDIPPQALNDDFIVLRIEPEDPSRVSFVCVPFPVADLGLYVR